MKILSYALLACLPAVAACHVQRSDTVEVVDEREPNNESDNANYLGLLRPGDRLQVNGCVCDPFFDTFDGFAFESLEAIDVEVELVWDSPFADFDICIYEPAIDEFVYCFDSPYNHVESGRFEVNFDSDFHIVVDALVGQGSYTLYVNAYSRGSYLKDAPSVDSGTADSNAASLTPVAERAKAFEGYRSGTSAIPTERPLPRSVTGWILTIDPDSGDAISTPVVGLASAEVLLVSPSVR